MNAPSLILLLIAAVVISCPLFLVGYYVAKQKVHKSIAALQSDLERCKISHEWEQQRRAEATAASEQAHESLKQTSAELAIARTESAQFRTALQKEQERQVESATRIEALTKQLQQLRSELTEAQTEATQCKTALQKEQERQVESATRIEALTKQLQQLRSELTEAQTEATQCKTALQKEQERHATEAQRIQEIQDKHFAQFSTLADKILEENAKRLKTSNQESMDGILKPLREQLVSLGKAVHDTNVASAEHKASLETALKGMMEKTDSLSKDAANLALALKGDNKKQGDWGEMVLERMLEESGLRKGEEYYTQETFKTEEGSNLRPDVVIRFPDNRCVVVDSKVSLTAYAQYMSSEDEEERFTYLNAHVSSVRKHIDELAGKDYASVVEDTISYVLMFVPNEASYMAAVQAAPSLPMDAYRRKIILISPTNLLMALQLAYNLWQKERQSRNVEAIFDRASKLYDKFATLKRSFEDVGSALNKAQASYDTGMNQLCRGSGNFAGQVQKLLNMGINPRNRLQLDEEESTEVVP